MDIPETIGVTDSGTAEFKTSPEAMSASTATHHVQHEIREPQDIMDSDNQNKNDHDNSTEIVDTFPENKQILAEPVTAKITSTQISNAEFVNDIGNFVGTNIDDLTKKNLLESPWKPTADYKMPYSVHMKKINKKSDILITLIWNSTNG